MKSVKFVLLAVLAMFMSATLVQAQENKKDDTKKVIILKKTLDEDGNVVMENIELEGDEAENMEWNSEDGNIRVHINSDEAVEKKVEVIVDDSGKHHIIEILGDDEDVEGHNLQLLQYDDKEEDGEHIIHLKLKTTDDGEVFEWKGNGQLPEDIKQKLQDKGLNMQLLDGEVPHMIHFGEEDFDFEMNGGGNFIFRSEDDGLEKVEKIIVIKKMKAEGDEDAEEEMFFEEQPDLPENRAALELQNFEVFPNPTDGRIQLKFEAEAAPTEIMISNVSGKSVYKRNLSNFDGIFADEIDLKDFPKGTHILQISQEGKVFTEKIILQ